MKRPVSDGCLESLGGVNFGLLLAGNVAFTVLLLLVSVELLIVRKRATNFQGLRLFEYLGRQQFKLFRLYCGGAPAAAQQAAFGVMCRCPSFGCWCPDRLWSASAPHQETFVGS